MNHNIFNPFPSRAREEFLTLLETSKVKIEQINSNGQPSPEAFWFDQTENEWVVLLKGSATLRYDEDRTLDLHEGDSLLIPAHTRHRVDSVSADALWLAVYYERC